MNVKILQSRIIFIFYPWETIGGAIIRTTNLIKVLSRYYEINLLILPPRKMSVLYSLNKSLQGVNVKVYFMPMKVKPLLGELDFTTFIKALSSIIKFLLQESRSLKQRSILYSRPPLYLLLASIFIGKLFSIPIVVEIHHHIYNDYKNSLFRLALKILEWLVLSLSTLVVVNSEIFYKELRNSILKSRPEKVILVKNCINIKELISLTNVEERIDLKRKKCNDIIGFVGSLKIEEDIITLLKAFKLVLQNKSDVCLIIVGEGPMRHYYEKLVKVLGLEGYVIFLGERSHEETIKIMRNLKIFIALRKKYQRTEFAAPLKVIEALALEIPLISTDLPPIREVAKDAAIFVPPSDYKAVATAILSLLSNPALSLELKERGKQYAIELDCEKVIIHLLQALSYNKYEN